VAGSPQSIRIRRPGSTAFTTTFEPTPYISHSQRTRAPGTSGPLPFENQKRAVTSGSANASKTSPAGRRISIPALATNAFESAMPPAFPISRSCPT
jgi:hypothetical protein